MDRFGTARISASLGRNLDFEVLVLLAPKRQPRQPVFAIDGLLGSGPLAGWKDAGGAVEVPPGDFTAYRAWRNQDARIVADPLVLSHVVARHENQLALVLGKPHRRANGSAVLAKGCERDVFLAAEFGWNRHQMCIPRLRGRVQRGEYR